MMKIIKGYKHELGVRFEDAARIRYDAYLQMHFIKENNQKSLQDTYDNTALHYLAIENQEVVGTISIISPPLPLSKLFQEEVGRLIKQYKAKKIVELSRFAVLPNYQVKNSSNPASPRLFRAVYFTLFLRRVDLVLAVVHPKYVSRYKNYGFKTYGKVKSYPKMEDNPAVLLYQTKKDLHKLIKKELFYKPFLRIFKKKADNQSLPRKRKKSF